MCLAGGVGRCDPCTNPLPIHAEYSAAGSPAFPYACPWTCRPGFWFNRTQDACTECTGYKPKHAHFVTASSSQVHVNPNPIHAHFVTASSSQVHPEPFGVKQVWVSGACPYQCDTGYEPALRRCESDSQWRDRWGDSCSSYEKNPGWCEAARAFGEHDDSAAGAATDHQKTIAVVRMCACCACARACVCT